MCGILTWVRARLGWARCGRYALIGRPYMLCRASNRCHTLKAAGWDELHWNDTAHVRTGRGGSTVIRSAWLRARQLMSAPGRTA